MLRIGHLEGEPALRHEVAAGLQGRGQDVDVVVRKHPGDVGQQPGPVQSLHLDSYQEDALRVGRPLDLDEPIERLREALHVGTVTAADRDTRALGDEADDVVARDGGAAAGQLDQQVARSVDHHTGVATAYSTTSIDLCRNPDGLGKVLGRALVAAMQLDDLAYDVLRA